MTTYEERQQRQGIAEASEVSVGDWVLTPEKTIAVVAFEPSATTSYPDSLRLYDTERGALVMYDWRKCALWAKSSDGLLPTEAAEAVRRHFEDGA